MEADFIVVGGGMAGASLAYFLAQYGRVIVIEAESQVGYHATGRSAALFAEGYGNATIRALTTASKSFLSNPPSGFAEHALLQPRGALFIGRTDQLAALDRWHEEITPLLPVAERRDGAFAAGLVPILTDAIAGCVWDPAAADIDVHVLHHSFLRALSAQGGRLLTDFRIDAITRTAGKWTVRMGDGGAVTAPILVNAAGAWADEIAAMAGVQPLGLVPMKRTALLVAPPEGMDTRDWPTVIDIDEQFYFKPDAGKLILSPADETPSEPCDVQPDELDIAIAVDRVCQVADLPVRRIEHKWAGLRTFAADRAPVVGFDPDVEGFFWLAGQGGYGIQTAPALGETAAALVRGEAIPDAVARFGITAADLAPDRLRHAPLPTEGQQP